MARSIVVVHHPRRAVSAAAKAVVEIIRQDVVAAAASASRYVTAPAQVSGARPADPARGEIGTAGGKGVRRSRKRLKPMP